MNMTPFKTIHIIVGLGLGGAEQMLKRLLLSDPIAHQNTIIISLTDFGKIGPLLREEGFTVHALNMHGPWSFPVALLRLVRLIRQYKPDIVQTWMYHADLLGGWAARLAGCRSVIWGVRGTRIPRKSSLTYWVLKLCSLFSSWVPSRIICVAEAARASHVMYGYCADKMVVISNGFDFSKFSYELIDKSQVRQSLGVTNGSILIGCVGRFHIDKGQDVFVKAASQVAARYPSAQFMLVGRRCDKHNASLIAQIKAHGLQNQFLLMGERSDIPECLGAIDVFCMPSRTEGFPNGLGEAMAMGLPCVATQVGDTEVLTADTVRLVQPENPEALAVALLEVLALTNEQRKAMGQRAAERVRNEFSIDKARERFYALYQEVLESCP